MNFRGSISRPLEPNIPYTHLLTDSTNGIFALDECFKGGPGKDMDMVWASEESGIHIAQCMFVASDTYVF